MLFLILAIFSSAMVSIIMRLSSGKVSGNFSMLVMNYLMCSLLCALSAGGGNLLDLSDPRLAVTAAMGCFNGTLYLASFVLLQVNVRRNGVVLSSTFMKLGLLVTMVISICFYGEMPSLVQALGFLLAVGAILLINDHRKPGNTGFKVGLIGLLLCGGMADAMSKIFEESGIPGMEGQFLFFTFFTAFLFCILCMLVKRQKIGRWEAFFGLLIGIPNFYSSKFLLRALEDVAAVIAYPVYSVATILTVTLTGVLFFRERLEKRQWVALGMILTALILLNT